MTSGLGPTMRGKQRKHCEPWRYFLLEESFKEPESCPLERKKAYFLVSIHIIVNHLLPHSPPPENHCSLSMNYLRCQQLAQGRDTVKAELSGRDVRLM